MEWDFERNNWKSKQPKRTLLTWYNTLSLVISGILWPIASFIVIVVQGIFYPKSISNDVLFFNVIIMTPCVLNFGLNFVLVKNIDVLAEYTGLLLGFVGKFQEMPKKEKLTIGGILRDLKQGKFKDKFTF